MFISEALVLLDEGKSIEFIGDRYEFYDKYISSNEAYSKGISNNGLVYLR